MGKYIYSLPALITVVLLLAGCAANGDVEARLGEEFSLSIGQTARITGENLQITFEEVTEDSRCAKDVTCIWEGQVRAAVQITDSDSQDKITLTQPGLTDQSAGEIYHEYRLSFKVEPYPEEAGRLISADEYRLLLTISK